MSKHFIFTDTLKPAKAKNLCNEIMSQPSWCDVMAGSTGIVVDETTTNHEDVNIDILRNIEIPQIASFNFAARTHVTPQNTNQIKQPLGYVLAPPNSMGSVAISLRVETGSLTGVSLSCEINNSYSRQAHLATNHPELFNREHVYDIVITVLLNSSLPAGMEEFAAHSAQYENELNQLETVLGHLNLPRFPHDSFFYKINSESNQFPAGSLHGSLRYSGPHKNVPPYLRYSYQFDALAQPGLKDVVYQMQEWLLKKHSSHRVQSVINYGRMNWFSGYPQCVTLEAKDLLRRECGRPQYDSYNISYMKLEPETWEVREKRRKQVTEPRFMQLGECELENGCKLTLRLKMLKEGYVVILDFPTDEDMIRFADTELYRKTKWQSSSE